MSRLAMALLLAAAVLRPGAGGEPALPGFRILRPITIAKVSGDDASDACAVLDADVLAHADPALADVRLFSAGRELPYALTLSRTASTTDPARVQNVQVRGRDRLAFDLAMPARPYSALDLDLSVRDFVASARVLGLRRAGDPQPTYLGRFSIFDLSTRGLGQDFAMPLPESTFPLLHVDLALVAMPGARLPNLTRGLVLSARVPPSREAQTLYTPIAQVTSFSTLGEQQVATAILPAHVPLERVSFTLVPTDSANFSRTVTITARPISPDGGQTTPDGSQTGAPEVVTGRVAVVHLKVGEQAVHESRLSIPFALGANAQAPAEVRIAIDNAGKPLLSIASMTLEMRQRKICFAAPDSLATVTLAYAGEPSGAISNEFARTFDPTQPVRAAELGPEQRNAAFHTASRRARARPWRAPGFLWVLLLTVLSATAALALRLTRKTAHPH